MDILTHVLGEVFLVLQNGLFFFQTLLRKFNCQTRAGLLNASTLRNRCVHGVRQQLNVIRILLRENYHASFTLIYERAAEFACACTYVRVCTFVRVCVIGKQIKHPPGSSISTCV